MQMLEKDVDTADVEVSLPDQENINAFSKLNNRLEEVLELLISLKQELEEVEEVETEMELIDEDELVMYNLDTSMLHLPAGKVFEMLQTSLESLKSQTADLEKEKDDCTTGMDKLKVILYAKFGRAINLER